jgi:hypothetical protein
MSAARRPARPSMPSLLRRTPSRAALSGRPGWLPGNSHGVVAGHPIGCATRRWSGQRCRNVQRGRPQAHRRTTRADRSQRGGRAPQAGDERADGPVPPTDRAARAARATRRSGRTRPGRTSRGGARGGAPIARSPAVVSPYAGELVLPPRRCGWRSAPGCLSRRAGTRSGWRCERSHRQGSASNSGWGMPHSGHLRGWRSRRCRS